ncbi:MAG: DEAD/DEAH box helicase [Deltaproteobacteria bacterium]|nr:DEAD/DEAH box helicase [Deltaproteobacteria bacterium]
MPIARFVEELKKRKDIRDFVHHEILEEKKASFEETKEPLHEGLKDSLDSLNLKKLYTHQSMGIDLVREGKNVVVMTPTASGKSLIYNIPVIESVLKDPEARALYLFPLKGLEQDQLQALMELTSNLCIDNIAQIYDGDTPQSKRKKIRENPPAVILSNPDMLHMAICAFHAKWERFLKDIKYVIIDEVHTYRGVLGSHVAQVLRRLRRILKTYGSEPVFIACSATIANPVELAGALTGVDFELIDKSSAPLGRRNFLFLDPPAGVSPYSLAAKLFTESVRRGFKTIAFTKARKITELIHRWVSEISPGIGKEISSYRAGFLPEERREIERKLFNDELSGVITTSALELGIDIGGLDVCILAGYPGTISSTWQRGGRVGRKGQDSLIVMVAVEDALDKYFMRHPQYFFGKSVEAAVVDIENPMILKSHLLCAAAESPVKSAGDVYDMDAVESQLKSLVDEKKLWYSEAKKTWNPKRLYPHREVSIRGMGPAYRIITGDNVPLGESDSVRVLKELHPGAIYLHRAVQYRVVSLNMGEREVICARADVDYYTAPVTEEETEILSITDKKKVGAAEINLGNLRITENVLGFRKKDIYTREVINEYPLKLPPRIFTTAGIWFTVGEDTLEQAGDRKYDTAGSLHALEHAAIAALPLYALCDRMDLGGVSYTFNPQLSSPAVFIYDGYEGGIGLTKRGFEVFEAWFKSALKLMEDCPCEVSCPSCTQDPKCGNNNTPLDKRGAVFILRKWFERVM